MELFFAKLLGLYFIVIGAVVLVRRSAIMPAMTQLASNRPLLLIMSVIEIAAGLALVVAYPAVSLSIAGVISLVGYMLVIEGIIYLAAPARVVRRMVNRFNRPLWYVVGGALSIAAGLYLAGKGFGYF